MIPNDVYRCFLDYANAKVVYALRESRIFHSSDSRYRERTQQRLIKYTSDEYIDSRLLPNGRYHGLVKTYTGVMISHVYYREGYAYGLSETW